MAQFFCVEGHDHGCDERIMEKYVQPYERMLAGDKNAKCFSTNGPIQLNVTTYKGKYLAIFLIYLILSAQRHPLWVAFIYLQHSP